MYLKPNQRIISGYVKNIRFDNLIMENSPFELVIFKDAKYYNMCRITALSKDKFCLNIP